AVVVGGGTTTSERWRLFVVPALGFLALRILAPCVTLGPGRLVLVEELVCGLVVLVRPASWCTSRRVVEVGVSCVERPVFIHELLGAFEVVPAGELLVVELGPLGECGMDQPVPDVDVVEVGSLGMVQDR